MRDVEIISKSEGKLRFDNGVEILLISNEAQIIGLAIFHAYVHKDCSYIDGIRRRITSRFGENEDAIDVYEDERIESDYGLSDLDNNRFNPHGSI